MEFSEYCSISYCVIRDTSSRGIAWTYSDYGSIINNEIISNRAGIRVAGSARSQIIGCYFSHNTELGLDLYRPASLIIEDCVFENDGMLVSQMDSPTPFSSFNNVSVNGKPVLLIENDHGYGIDGSPYGEVILINCVEMSIVRGDFRNTDVGVSILNCSSCSVRDAEFESNDYGIYDYESDDTNIRNCIFGNSSYGGIFTYGLEESIIEGCQFYSSTLFVSRQSFQILNNTFTRCGTAIYGSWPTTGQKEALHNFVNGKPLGFYYHTSNISIDGSDYGQIIIIDCYNITVANGQFEDTHTGIIIEYGNMVHLHNISSNRNHINGVYMHASDGCTIQNCDMAYNERYGLEVSSCSYCSIENSTLSFNGISGISLEATYYSDICNNHFSYNNISGFYMSYLMESLVVNNTIVFNTRYGIENDDAHLTYFYRNQIGANGKSPVMTYHIWDSYWDDGVSIGNYWEIYDGNGVFHIPYSEDIDHFPQTLTIIYPDPSGTTPIQGISIISIVVTLISGIVIVLGSIVILREKGYLRSHSPIVNVSMYSNGHSNHDHPSMSECF